MSESKMDGLVECCKRGTRAQRQWPSTRAEAWPHAERGRIEKLWCIGVFQQQTDSEKKEETKTTRWHSLLAKAAHWERVGTAPPLSTCPLLHVVFFLFCLVKFPFVLFPSPTPPSPCFYPISFFLPLFKAVITHPGRTITHDFIPMQLPPNQCPQVWNSITRHKTGGSTHLHIGGAKQKH